MSQWASRRGSTYAMKPVGFARRMDEANFSDGSTALEITNWRMDERGVLDSTFRIMPLANTTWCILEQPNAFTQGSGVMAMAFSMKWGSTPEVLMLASSGTFRLAPWARNPSSGNGGLEELFHYPSETTQKTVKPGGRGEYAPQIEVVGNRMYFTYCDGGAAWVWDMEAGRLRPFGYTRPPAAPEAEGPSRNSAERPNSGGFSVQGRVGTTDSTFADSSGAGVGGIDDGLWRYAMVYEGVDGNYSATSPEGGAVSIRRELSNPDAGEVLEDKLRRFRLIFSGGPNPTAALILLRTANLRRLPAGDYGEMHFLHRIANNVADEWIDDLPDGELGPTWDDRESVPVGFYFLRFFSGSMFMLRNEGAPARVWWSEQTALTGPTPESIMRGHWRDVYPSTGPITGAHETSLAAGDSAQPALLIFKNNAVHYVTGEYPNWRFGTLPTRAGLAGPNLVQTAADGSVVWYGARTFWRLKPDGQVVDIGEPIRKRLKRLNPSKAGFGQSYVVPKTGEVVFYLPSSDADLPDTGFVWDSRVDGWRMLDDVRKVRSVLSIREHDLVLASARWDGLDTVWVLGRSYAGVDVDQTVQATYTMGWHAMTKDGYPDHNAYNVRQIIFTMEDRSAGAARLRVYKDWDLTQPTTDESESVRLSHPEIDTLTYLSDGTTTPSVPVVYDESTWRAKTAYTVAASSDSESSEVVAVMLTTSNPMALVGAEVYAPELAKAGGRTPRISEAS